MDDAIDAGDAPLSAGRKLVLAVLAIIGAFDVASGASMLLSDHPWLLGGMADAWTAIPQVSFEALGLSERLRGPYVRIAAFSFHIGVLTLFLAWQFRRSTRLLGLMLILYTIDGLAFAYYDHTFTAGTRYFYIKQALGVLWTLALVVHFVGAYRERARAASGA